MSNDKKKPVGEFRFDTKRYIKLAGLKTCHGNYLNGGGLPQLQKILTTAYQNGVDPRTLLVEKKVNPKC